MGQYNNQPDFGTKARSVTPSDTIDGTTMFKDECLYVGTGGDVSVILTGVTGDNGVVLPDAQKAILFKNVPDGSFLPVIVSFVLDTDTTASDIIAIK